jgi:hypothetical protein
MNNTTTRTTLITTVAIFMAATLVVGGTLAAVTTQSAFAYQQKKKGSQESNKNGNTITIQKCKQDGTASGFDNAAEQECGNTICTHPGNNATCIQEAFVPSSANHLVVCKVVKDFNTGGNLDPASAFTLQVIGNNPSQSSFPGSPPPTCTTITLDPGGFQVREVGAALATGSDGDFCNGFGLGKDVILFLKPLNHIYCVNFSQGCSGTIAAGETKTCTVTNTAVDIG